MAQSTKNVAAMSGPEKLGEAIQRSLPLVPAESRIIVEGLLTPESLAVLTTAATAWGASHFFGVGEVADVVLIIAGAAFLGKSAIDVATDLMKFVHGALDAETERELEVAGEHFAGAVAAVGVNVVAALLLHRTTAGTRARLSRSVKPVARDRLFYRPTVKGDPMLAPGSGVTNKFGDITYSTRGSATDQALALRHESVHSALSPRLMFLRNVRADLAMTAYQRSQFLRYLEEALAETYAQVSVRGIRGIPDSIKFPLKSDGYALTVKGVVTEGAVGSVSVGGVTYGVYVLASD